MASRTGGIAAGSTPNVFDATFRRLFCSRFGALAPDSFWNASDAELKATCNGVGAERWPRWLRAVLSVLLRPLDASSAPHDWEYSLPDKSYRHFTEANFRLAVNACKEALYDVRPAVIPLGILAAVLCQIFGWHAYRTGRTGSPEP